MEHKIAHKAGGAVGAHFFLVCQNAYRSVFRLFHTQLRLQRGIGAHTVIVAVRADHTAVKAHIRRLDGRNGLQLRAGKITFGDAVFLVQERQRIQLDALFQLFVRIRQRADHDIQLLAPQTVRQRAFILLCAQVRQQVRHAKHRVSRFLAQADFHLGAVLAVHYTVQGQRRGSPLVFANPTVIMRLEQRDVAVLVQRIRFEVKTRGINVRYHQTHALVQRALAQRSQKHGLAAVVVKNLVTGFICNARALHRPIARRQRTAFHLGSRLPLSLGRVQKRLVVHTEALGLRNRVRLFIRNMRLCERQFFLQFLAHALFFFHCLHSFILRIKREIFLIIFIDLMHVQVHLLIGECRKSFSIRRIFRLLQQTVHKPHAAVVRRRRSGKIPVIACKAGRKQICAEADVHRRVEQIVESNLLAGRDLGFDPQKRLVCDLHQPPCPHLGFRLRLEAAFSTDDGIHLILVHSVLCGILLHQRGIGARICHFLHGAHRVLYEKNTR